MHKVTPLGQLSVVHLHNEVQQNFVLDGTSFNHPCASLPAIEARTDDYIRLFTVYLLSYFDSFSRVEKIPHLATPMRSQVQHIF